MTLDIKHTNVFTRNLESKKRIKVNQGGTRSSKTYSIAQLLIYKAMSEEPKTYSIVRGAMPTLRATAMRDFFTILKELGLYLEAAHNKTENIYNLNGSLFEFFSLDDEQKVRGRKRDVLWINEANETDLETWRQLIFRTDKDVFIDFNPSESEEHWIFTELLERDDVDLIISTYKDNAFLSDTLTKEIENLQRLDPAYWTVYGLGQRADVQSGTVFMRKNYKEYERLPLDVRSVIYCDPNLAIKSKGDSTAITNLGYSPSTDNYYVISATCKSFADSNELLDAVLLLKTNSVVGIGFDGNVNQESTWTNLVRNWSKIHESPFYRIEYKRYKIDDLAKNIQLTWSEGRILFPPGFKDSVSSKMYLAQLFSFRGKKAGLPDDAPDSLIGSFEFLHERGLAAKKSKPAPHISIKTNYYDY